MMLEGPVIEANILPKSGSITASSTLDRYNSHALNLSLSSFEKLWLNHPDFQELSQSWWEKDEISHGSLMYKFQQRLKNFKMHLRDWNKNVFGNIFQDQRTLEMLALCNLPKAAEAITEVTSNLFESWI
jgi:hypothetical protein